MKLILLISIPFVLIGCSKFVQMTDEQYYEKLDSKGNSELSIMFSHNINGETHPCGCRQFPLGGLPQVNGIIKSQETKSPTIYVDTGDTFFETTIIPSFIQKSSEFKARKIAEAMDKLNLKIFTPGDQDFSMGESFLKEISNKYKFKFLISNSSDLMTIKHQKLIRIDTNGLSLFFIGILSPELLRSEYKKFVQSPYASIKEQLKSIKENHSDIKNKKIILMSHSGIDYDERLAKNFPEINWIIGAHSQSYLRFSKDVNNAQIVQVLSRNHHIGHITIPLNNKEKGTYKIIEAHDAAKDLIKNNSFKPWLADYKSQLDKVHATEQNSVHSTETNQKIPTYVSCSDCHTKQVQFWQGTAHSLAYSTLIKAKSANNPSCVKCHSVGHNQEGGFFSPGKIVLSSEKSFSIDNYWKDFTTNIKTKEPVRKLSHKKRAKIANAWLEMDTKHQVTDNFSNVQCLNCHGQNHEHPFEDDESAPKNVNFESKCLQCHTTDQSPEWYGKDAKGLATSLNQKYFAKKLKEVSCPKIERY